MRRSLVLSFALSTFALGCGAPSAKYMVDDVTIASVPMTQKQSVYSAEQDLSVARAEQQKAAADLDTTKKEVEVASNEYKQAKLEVDKTKMETDLATASKDPARQTASTQSTRTADLGSRAAKAKLDVVEAKRKWQDALADLADSKVRMQLARKEMEKAKIAQANNIKPTKDFNVADFIDEFGRRQRTVDDVQRKADERRMDMERLTQSYNDFKLQYEQSKMVPGAQQQPMPTTAYPPPVRQP